MANTLMDVLGRQPMTPSDLLKEINKAGWPYKAVVNGADFFALVLQMGLSPETDVDAITRYFWVGPTKVVGDVNKGFLNLRDWSPPLIEMPTGPRLVK